MTKVGLLRDIAALLMLALINTGCASLGPGVVGRDRSDYEHAVTESWQRQLLMNLVKIRYGDTPFFLDVSSITNSYNLSTQVNMAATWWGGVVGSGPHDNLSVGASGIYTDKPTITYNPLLGQRFTRSLMTPVPPGVVISLIQAGWTADAVLRVMVTSLNGVQNRFAGGARARGADPAFYRLCSALRRLQASGAVGMRVDRLKDQEWAVMTLNEARLSEDLQKDQDTIREILGLRKDIHEIRVNFGSAPKNDQEVAIITRSMLEILIDIAGSIDVPPSHAQSGRTSATKTFETDVPGGFRPMIRVLSGVQRPEDAFVAIKYRDHWFWIEDLDLPSKGMFSFLLILSSLNDVDTGRGTPLVTIPAN
jgi:hypothetical protein